MLVTNHLTFDYGPAKQFAFPDLHCADREALLILGRSGTGKTTLLHLLALLLRPKSGSVTIGQTDLTKLSPAQTAAFRAKHVGIIYQKPHFVSSLSVVDNLMLANYLADKPQQMQRARELAGQLGFADQLSKKTHQLSQGEQQRVGGDQQRDERQHRQAVDRPQPDGGRQEPVDPPGAHRHPAMVSDRWARAGGGLRPR